MGLVNKTSQTVNHHELNVHYEIFIMFLFFFFRYLKIALKTTPNDAKIMQLHTCKKKKSNRNITGVV